MADILATPLGGFVVKFTTAMAFKSFGNKHADKIARKYILRTYYKSENNSKLDLSVEYIGG